MYILLLIFLKCDLIIGSSFSNDIELESISVSDFACANEIQVRYKQFRLNKQEIPTFYNSLKRLEDINKLSMNHFMKLKLENRNDFFSIDSLLSFEAFIDYIATSRKNSENQHVYEYEFTKFYEFFFRSLYHIIRYEAIFVNDFFQYIDNIIIPILQKLGTLLNACRFFRLIDILREILHIRKFSDEDRRSSLVHFILSFLASHQEVVTIDQIDENFNIQDLLPLCLNLFVRFYMSSPINDSKKFEQDFILQKFLISNQFIDFLFTSGGITRYAFHARLKLRKFLSIVNLDLEKQFLEQKLIPCIFDKSNKDASIFGLIPIGYSKDQ